MHIAIILLAPFALIAVAAYFYAKRKKETVAALLKSVLDAAWGKGLQLEAGIANKIHALENGGHLASGTSDSLASATSTSIAATSTNGGQPAANSTQTVQ
jgi:hypothetical protein